MTAREQANVMNRHEKFDVFGRTDEGQSILKFAGLFPEKLDHGNTLVESFKQLSDDYDASRSIEANLRSIRDQNHSTAERGILDLRDLIKDCFSDNEQALINLGVEARFQNITIPNPEQIPTPQTDPSENPEQNPSDTPENETQPETPAENPQTGNGHSAATVSRRRVQPRDLLAQRLIHWPRFLKKVAELEEPAKSQLASKGGDEEYITDITARVQAYKIAYRNWDQRNNFTFALRRSRDQSWDIFNDWFVRAARRTRRVIRDFPGIDKDQVFRSFGINGTLSEVR